MPSVSCAGGVVVWCGGVGSRGRIGPFGVVLGGSEIRKGQILFIHGHRVSVDPQSQLGIAVAQLVRNPPD